MKDSKDKISKEQTVVQKEQKGSGSKKATTLLKLCSYNMKIIFGGKFIWFLITGFLLFFYFMFDEAWQGIIPSESKIYGYLFFPSLLLVFYPAVFGIQNDADQRILEIIFGIPNYMYKVWIIRLFLVYIEVFFILALFAWIATYLLFPVQPFEMAYQLMYPVLFMGNLAFYFSTVTRNGNGAAILIIICGIVMTFLQSSFTQHSLWDVMLNPFELPENIHPVIWDNTVFKNRLFLGIGSFVWILLSLLNLQKRERFV